MCVAQIGAITAVISGIGTVAVAANHLAVTAESLSYMPAYGVASSRNYNGGAGYWGRT